MKLTGRREAFIAPLAAAAAATDGKALPILSTVLVRADAGGVAFTGTDLQIEIVAPAPGIVGDGAACVPAKRFLDIVRALPEGAEIAADLDGERLILKSGRSRYALVTLPVYNFPSFVAGELAEPISIPVDVLAAGLEATRFCMAIKDVRYYLNGLAVEGGDGLTLVASDGHRLAKFQAEIAGEIPTMILPRDVVAELLRYLKGAESVALVTGRPGPNSTVNTASFLFDGGLRLYCRLIEGKYPDWRRVRPREIDRTATIDRAGLIQALGRAALFGGDYQAVSLRFQPGALTITAANQETEEAEEEIAVEWNGKPLEVGFSAKYLVEALGGLSSDTVRMGFPAEANNCVVDDPDDARLSYVVMPMRL